MQTRSLQTLHRVSQLGSFQAAADALNMTLPAVSMQIKALEERLGVVLFDRAFRPPKLTPVGLQIASKAEALLHAEEELLSVAHGGDQLSGHFQFGFVSTASVRLLPTFLLNAHTSVPKARFDVETGLSEVLEQRVLKGELDAAVVTAQRKADEALDYLTLRSEPLVLVVPTELRDQRASDLATHLPFLQFRPTTGVGKLIAGAMKNLRKRTSPPEIVLDAIEPILECVKLGVGFSLLPKPDAERYADEHVALIEDKDLRLTRDLSLATLKGSAANRLKDAISDLFEADT
ncbi:MAG: LysR family transcriptional regulator [Pseudomonadota bacterium]